MYNSPGLQFLRTTTGIQSGPDVFDELSFIMNFFTIFGEDSTPRLLNRGGIADLFLLSTLLAI